MRASVGECAVYCEWDSQPGNIPFLNSSRGGDSSMSWVNRGKDVANPHSLRAIRSVTHDLSAWT